MTMYVSLSLAQPQMLTLKDLMTTTMGEIPGNKDKETIALYTVHFNTYKIILSFFSEMLPPIIYLIIA